MAKDVKVEIVGDASKYKKALGDAEGATDKFSGQLKKVALAVGAAFAVDKVVAFAGDAIGSASDLNEVMSKTQVVFGDSSAAVVAFADKAAKSFGLSKKSALEASANFAIFGKSAGLTGKKLTTFSGDLTGLAADMASFSNTTPQEAIDALGAALRGESEPIRKYGVLLDDATLKARALELGIYDGTGALSQQQRVLAAQAEILAQTSDAQGDFARTSDGLANQQRIMAAEFENVKAQIGEKLLPVMVKLVTWINDTMIPAVENVVSWFEENWPKIEAAVIPVFEKIRGYIEGFVSTVQAIWDKFGTTIVEFIRGHLESMRQVFKGVFDVISGIFQLFKDLFTGNWSKLWGDVVQIVTGFKDIIVGAVAGIWNAITSAAKLAWDGVKDFVTGALDAVVGFVTGMPGRIAKAATGMWDGIKAGFKSMINGIIGFWNGLEFTFGGYDIPGPGPNIPGFTLGMPDIPKFAQGGIVPGAHGAPIPAIVHGGEMVLNDSQQKALLNGGTGGGVTIQSLTIQMPVGSNGDDVIRTIKRFESRNGPGWRS